VKQRPGGAQEAFMIAEKTDRGPHPLLWTQEEFDRMLRLDLLRGRKVALRDGALYERGASGALTPLRWTGEEYYRLGDAGLLDGVRVELVDGALIEMSPINSPHTTCVTLAADLLRALFVPGFVIRTQNPLALGAGGYPEPDIAVVRGVPRDFAAEHPRNAVLVVEVADTSLRYDRITKAALYASAGIPEYWIVNLNNRTLEVYRLQTEEFQPDPGSRYAEPIALGAEGEIAPVARPEARVRVAELLP
jgi:Uma2 family endonuclease